MSPSPAPFYVTGGTLRGDAPCYVERQADRDLYAGLTRGEFSYVLTSRQMGKSSLMVRAAQRLRVSGAAVAILDLTALGQNLTAEQWYDGLLGLLGRQLGLEDELEQFWLAQGRLGPLERWMRALCEVALPRCPGPLVVFVDEIDFVRSLPFATDEFFAAIRECYNRRTADATLNRLSFCLLGVALPSDLIRDARTTPFNIGKRVELQDFTEAEAAPLARGLGRDMTLAAKLLRRVLYWTGGHPYLTQRLCQAVAEDATVVRPAGVDRVSEELFLSHRARERDDNLLFVRERLLRSDRDRAGLLDLYERVRRGRRVPDDETSPLVAALRLSGVVRVSAGCLCVRNRIYSRVFDRGWAWANMPDAEKRRQRAAFRRGALRASVVAAVVLAGIASAILWYWDAYLRPVTEYYSAYTKRWGIPQGIGSVTEGQWPHRQSTLRFTRKGRWGKVATIEAIDGKGRPSLRHGVGTYMMAQTPIKPWRWEFVRDANDSPVYETAYDRTNRLVWGMPYFPLGTRDRAVLTFVDRRGFPQCPISSADVVEITRPEPDGYDQKVRFFDVNHQPQSTPDNCYGQEFTFNSRGLIDMVKYLGPGGEPMTCRLGYAIRRLQWDERGNILGERYFDANGRPVISREGYARATFLYDRYGNQIETAYWDVDGNPALHQDGYAKFKAVYAEDGALIENTYWGPDDQPVLQRDGYAKARFLQNQDGDTTEITYYGVDGQPTLQRDGYARMTLAYDQYGSWTQVAYWGLDGQAVSSSEGYARIEWGYDDRGNPVEEKYFDPAGSPAQKDGYVRREMHYDSRGNRTGEAYFDEERRPARCKDGYAAFQAVFDDRGNPVQTFYLDATGGPGRHTAGNAGFTARYDERGNRIEMAYLDEARQPFEINDGSASWRAKYDDPGNQVEAAFFDKAGRPVKLKAGYAKWRAAHDARGNQTQLTYFDEHDRPVRSTDGIAGWSARFDDRDNEVERDFFDEAHNPVRNKDGNTGWTKLYNARGLVVEQTLFGFDGRDGYVKMAAKLDANANPVELTFLDARDQPVRLKDGYSGWTAEYDAKGDWVGTSYFDADHKPVRTRAVITEVLPDSKAARVGLKVGDVLVSYDGKEVLLWQRIAAEKSSEPDGLQPKELRVLRDGKELAFRVPSGRLGMMGKDRALPGSAQAGLSNP
jgi:hypothetical protein